MYLWSAILGGGLLALQVLSGLLGFDHADAPDSDLHLDAAEGLDLVSVRSVGAGVLLFGVTGLTLQARDAADVITLVGAVLAGLIAMVVVAFIMRAIRRLESDGTVRLEHAIGRPGTVYLSIPGADAGRGKVTLVLQGRSVEYPAVSKTPLPTGAPVVVIDVLGPDLLEVAPPRELEIV